jgi:hypothetical protein
VEASRKHGSFDTRWPCVRNDNSHVLAAAPRLSAREAAEALDWQAFSARYFPERRRHDSESVSAYAAYKQGREWRTAPAGLRLVPSEQTADADEREREEVGTRRLMAAMAASATARNMSRLPR